MDSEAVISWCFVSLLAFLHLVEARGVVPDEQLLYRDLMADYQNSVRPVINASKSLTVKFGLRLNQIIALDERLQTLTTNVFIDQEWQDESLRWNSSKYNGVQTLRVPAKDIWLPDTFVYNNANNGTTGFMTGTYVLLKSDGKVAWPVPVKLRSSCKVDITYFPFDDQKCELIFGSWIYGKDLMDYVNKYNILDLTYYNDSTEWELLKVEDTKQQKRHTWRDETFNHLIFTLYIRRKTFYYIFNIIIPCTSLSVLTLLTFWLPAAAAEKITLGLSVFLAFSMFMLLIAEQVPATSNSVPLIGVYLTTVMTMTSMSVVMAVMVINLFNRGAKVRRAPRWLCKLMFNWVSKVMRINVENLKKSFKMAKEGEEHGITTLLENESAGYRKSFRQRNRKERVKFFERRLSTISCIEGFEALQRRLSTTSSRNGHVLPDDKTKWSNRNDRRSPYPSTGSMERSPRTSFTYGDNNTQELPVFSVAPTASMEDLSVFEETSLSLSRQPSSRRSSHLEVYDQYRRGSNVSDEIWHRREEFNPQTPLMENHQDNTFLYVPTDASSIKDSNKRENKKLPKIRKANGFKKESTKLKNLQSHKDMIIEWQTIAVIIDRLLFWFFCFATVFVYIFILIVMPHMKPKIEKDLPTSSYKMS